MPWTEGALALTARHADSQRASGGEVEGHADSQSWRLDRVQNPESTRGNGANQSFVQDRHQGQLRQY